MRVWTTFGKLAAVVALLGAAAPGARAAELRLASGFGDPHSSSRALATVFKDEVEANTDHTVEIFANSELGQATEMINQAQSGINFGVYVSSAFFNAQVPDLGVTNLPFVFGSREQAFAVLDGPFGDDLKAQFLDKGLEVLGFMELGFRNLTNSVRPIETPEDLAGLKIRLQKNPVHIATFEELGVSPIAIDWSETFAALRQGVIDGQENPYTVINTFQLYDANQQYLTDSGHFFDILVFAVSKRMMDRLSPEDQAAIREAGRLATLEQRRLAASEDTENLEALRAAGMSITELTDDQRAAFQQATQPVYALIGETLGQDRVDAFVAAVKAAQ